MTQTTSDLPSEAFAKVDPGDDALFYAPARLVTHIDEGATAALTAFYRTLLPPGGRVLDLMSSWVSHLPPDYRAAEVVGHGMNAAELAANPRLARWFVQDLNRDPVLPPDAACFDAALCCVGVQYLQRPVEVFAAVRARPAAGRAVLRQLLQPLLSDQGGGGVARARRRRPRAAGADVSRARRLRHGRPSPFSPTGRGRPAYGGRRLRWNGRCLMTQA